MHSRRLTLAQTKRMNVLHGTCTSQHIGRHALRAPCTPGDLPSLGCPRIPSHSSLGCPWIARSDGLGRIALDALGWRRSDGLECPACWERIDCQNSKPYAPCNSSQLPIVPRPYHEKSRKNSVKPNRVEPDRASALAPSQPAKPKLHVSFNYNSSSPAGSRDQVGVTSVGIDLQTKKVIDDSNRGRDSFKRVDDCECSLWPPIALYLSAISDLHRANVTGFTV
ncbi:hypothetical protein F3Y22_tig00110556pilonHSYRG00865 [Hibiscus syriacus]|uniref:Uncharacterized protein n=1 Tax=Hibiscus syriacus TaxID=106335 RepID=A0A6A3AA85_HIBSY|nr:hypothetical protein F3Y22_tig00110556pilonHSYRG00865 [Hibiscus syriacus]